MLASLQSGAARTAFGLDGPKIDRSLVARGDTGDRVRSVFEWNMATCAGHGVQTMAEGVEAPRTTGTLPY